MIVEDNTIWLYFLLLTISFVVVMLILVWLDNRKTYIVKSKIFDNEYKKKYIFITITQRGYEYTRYFYTESDLFFRLSPGDKITKKEYKELKGV